MLRKTILLAGALVATAFVSTTAVQASIRHQTQTVGGGHYRVAHGTHFVRARDSVVQLTAWAAGRRPAVARFARHRVAHRAVSHRVYRRVGRADTAIQSDVGPRQAYAPVSTGANGQVGQASFYSGGRTANGGHVGGATCAHRSLPFGTRVLVTNLANAHQMVLTVNDRGPFVGGRIIDVSTGAAATLGMLHSGTAPVRVQVIGGPG